MLFIGGRTPTKCVADRRTVQLRAERAGSIRKGHGSSTNPPATRAATIRNAATDSGLNTADMGPPVIAWPYRRRLLEAETRIGELKKRLIKLNSASRPGMSFRVAKTTHE